MPSPGDIHTQMPLSKEKRVSFADPIESRARELKQVALFNMNAVQVQHAQHAQQKEEATRQLVIDAYIEMSQMHLPNHIYEAWFGPGGVLSSPCAPMALQPLAERVFPAAPAPVPFDEASINYRLPPPTPLPYPRVARTGGQRSESVDPNGQLDCELRQVGHRSDQAGPPVPIPRTSITRRTPQAKKIIFLGDGTLSDAKITDLVFEGKLVLDPESKHRFPPTEVLNLCKVGPPPTFDGILKDPNLISMWSKFKPDATILQLGTNDIMMGVLGQDPAQQTYWKYVHYFCTVLPKLAMRLMNSHSDSREIRTALDEQTLFYSSPPFGHLVFWAHTRACNPNCV